MNIKNNQSGIAHLAAIVIVIIIVAIGAVGWKVWENKSTKTNTVTQKDSAKTTKDTPPKSKYDKCLRLEDYKLINGGEPLDYYIGSTESTMTFEEILYKPDSSQYVDSSAAKASAKKYADFYAKYKDNFWSLSLQGEIKDIDGTGNSASNTKLATDRADRFKDDLTSLGVAEDKISITKPNITSSDSNVIDNARNVTVRVTSQCKAD